MLQLIKYYIVTFIVFMGIDMIWLGLIARKFYSDQIGYLMKSDVNWVAAVIFYLIFVGGLLYFVLLPAILSNNIKQAIIAGAVFGFITYATYDLTNLATLKDWPILVTIVDMIWGATLAATVSALSFLIITKL